VLTDLTGWLIESGVTTSKEVDAFAGLARERKEPLWAALLDAGKITEAFLADTFAERVKIPLMSLASCSTSTEAVHHIPETVARRYSCIPLTPPFIKLANLVLAEALMGRAEMLPGERLVHLGSGPVHESELGGPISA
jgi:hypothetical protein